MRNGVQASGQVVQVVHGKKKCEQVMINPVLSCYSIVEKLLG